MKKNLFFIMIILIIFGFNSSINAETIKLNDTIYFLDTKDWGDIYMYIFNSDTDTSAWQWQDEQGRMTNTNVKINNHYLYVYTLTNSYYQNYHNSIIFSSKNAGKQTKDLSYIKKNVIFAPSVLDGSSSNYDGEWYIKDKSTLKNLIDNASSKVQKLYTNNSFTNMTNILNTKQYSYPVVAGRDYKTNFTGANDIYNTSLVLVTSHGLSVYDDAVSDLDSAIRSLALKNKAFNNTSEGGIITLNNNYFENNEIINFEVTPQTEYDVESITVTKITGYNQDNTPILSTNQNDIKTVSIKKSNEYSFQTSTSDIYITAKFKKKEFTITSEIIGKGSLEPTLPIKIEYGGNKEFIVTVEKGYKIKTILINDEEYILQDNKIVLTNITQNIKISALFKLIPKIQISNIDVLTKEKLSGAILQVLDSNKKPIKDEKGNEIYKWNSTKSFFIIENLPLGTYYLKQIKEPSGYTKNEELIKFTVDENTEIKDIFMKNNPIIQVENTSSKKSNLFLIIPLIVLITVGSVVIYIIKKNNYTKSNV